MRPCPKDSPDFRTQQCSEFNGKHFGLPDISEDVKWVPKYSGSKYVSNKLVSNLDICGYRFYIIIILHFQY